MQVDKDGQGIIDFPNMSSRDNGLNHLKCNFKVAPNDRPQRTLLPKITIKDIVTDDFAENDETDEEKLKNLENLKQAICDKNPIINDLIEKGKMFEILFIKRDARRDKFSIAVAKVDDEIRKAIQSMKYQIFINFSRCRVSDRFHVTQCYKCQQFGHLTTNCKSTTHICRFCSENHESKKCPHIGNVAKYKCGNCGLNHCSTYAGCTVLQNQVINLANRTQGLDTFSKNDIRRDVIIT